MQGHGRVLAFDRDAARCQRLQANMQAAGAQTVVAACADFLALSMDDARFTKSGVQAALARLQHACAYAQDDACAFHVSEPVICLHGCCTVCTPCNPTAYLTSALQLMLSGFTCFASAVWRLLDCMSSWGGHAGMLFSTLLRCVLYQVDPSCSGSGTAHSRLDHLLPSSSVADKAHAAAASERVQRQVPSRRLALSRKRNTVSPWLVMEPNAAWLSISA